VTPIELSRELEANKFRPVYYLYGEADYRAKEAEKAIVKKFLPKSQLAVNHFSFSASRDNAAEILTALSIFPLMGERQVFTIDDVRAKNDEDIKKILALQNPPDPNRIIILSSSSDKAPKKDSKVFRLMEKHAAIVEFKRLPDGMAEKRIAPLLKKAQVQIEPDALRMVLTLGGGDSGGLVEEVNKLINYVGTGGKITLEDVAKVGSNYQAFRVFDIANRAAAGDFAKSLEIVNSLLSQGETASALLYQLGEHFLDLYLYKQGRLPAEKQKKKWIFDQQKELFDNQQLEQIIELAAEANFELRGNPVSEKFCLEKLILEICRMRAENIARKAKK
jgi:DNA polymerase-3 subunit delta